MSLLIDNRIERKRLNGYRKPGHSYLVGERIPFQCCSLPVELPEYLMPSKGLHKMDFALWPAKTVNSGKHCLEKNCALSTATEIAGYMWVPENEYPSASHWFTEVRTAPVNLDSFNVFKPVTLMGKFILVAHRVAIVDYSDGCQGWVDPETRKAHTTIKYKPAIFAMFQVQDLHYIVSTEKPDAKLKKLYKAYQDSGHRLIHVIPEEEMEKKGFPELMPEIT
jgi:hypothetical protein